MGASMDPRKLTKLKPNPISRRLFQKVCHGKWSAAEAVGTAKDIVAVFGDHNDIVSDWASIGKNSQRDLLNWAKSFGLELTPAKVKVTYRNMKNNGTRAGTHYVLYPHELIHAIYTSDRRQFELSFLGTEGDAGLRKFWEFQRQFPWADKHPGFTEYNAGLDEAIPIGFHSDKGQHIKKDKILTMSWGSVMSSELTEWRNFVFTILPDDMAVPGVTAEQIHAVFTWSCFVLLSGVFPSADPEGNEWPKNSWRSKMAEQQQPIAGLWT